MTLRKFKLTIGKTNNQDVCDCKINKVIDDYISLIFSGRDWSIELILKSLFFQRNTTYLESNISNISLPPPNNLIDKQHERYTKRENGKENK